MLKKVVLIFLSLVVCLNAHIRLSESAYKKITQIQKLTQKKNYSKALELINKVKMKDQRDIDLAYLLQNEGYIYVSLNKYKNAIKSFEKMNHLNVMGEKSYLNTIFNLAQLNMSIENYKRSINYLTIWISKSKKKKAKAYLMLGQNYALINRHKNAVPNIKKAIVLQKKLKKRVPISWHELLFSNYYTIKDYKGAVNTLHTLLKIEPKKKNYWIYLSQIYTLQKQTKKALSFLEQAYNLNILNEQDIIHFSKFLSQKGLYYKAAKLLDKHIKSKKLKANTKNLELVFEQYFNAKEYKSAIVVLDRLSKKAKKSKYYLQKARIYSLLHNHKEAIKSYEMALKDKTLKDYFKANLELSYLYYEIKEHEKCKICLNIASKNKSTKKVAVNFLQQLSVN